MAFHEQASPLPRRVAAGWCLLIALMFVSTSRAASASYPNISKSRRHIGRLTTYGEMWKSQSREVAQQSWQNFTNAVFRLDGEQDLHWPELKLNGRSIAAIIFGGIGASLCTAAGLGGGGFFVILFNLLLQFDSKTSAALSNFMVAGGQFISMFLNIARSHPVHPERPLIDFDAALLLQPNLLLGISMGVILNIMFPNWLITLSLTVVLTCLAVNSFQSGVKRWKKESQQLALLNEYAGTKIVAQSWNASGGTSGDVTEPLLERHSAPWLPRNKIIALSLVWLVFLAVQVIRGGKGGKSKCGVGYWLLTSTQIPLALIVTYYAIKNLQDSAPTSKEASESWDDDFVLGPKESSLLPKLALATGILGGMLGIGGAMIINPMLMSAGMHPQVTAATSSFMVVFSASLSVVQYWLMGRVPVDWALTSAALSAVFSASGILVVERIIKMFGRSSVIVFVVSFIIGISALLMGSLGGLNVWQQFQNGAYMGFHYPC